MVEEFYTSSHQLFSCSVVNCSFYFANGKSISIFAWHRVRYVLEYQSIKRLQNCNGPMLLAAILLLKQLQYYPLFIRTKEPTKQGTLESHNGVMAFTASVKSLAIFTPKVNFRDG